MNFSMSRLIFVLSLLLFAIQYSYTQSQIVDLLEISTPEQLENAINTYDDYLDDAVSEEEILQCMFEISQLKCYFPCTDYEDLIETVKKHKIKGISADVKFAAATVSKFLRYELSIGAAQTLLQIDDRTEMFDTIGQSVY